MNKKMNFEEFKDVVINEIKKWLPESFRTAQVRVKVIEKNNDMKLTGLMIKRSGNPIEPMIYLEGFYKQYQEGTEMEDIMRKISNLRMEHDQIDGIDINMITEIDQCKDRIVPRLVNKKWNKELLANRPYVEKADLAVVFVIDLGVHGDGTMSVPITMELMKRWNLKVEDLYDIAIENQERADDGLFVSMSDMLMDMLGAEIREQTTDADDSMFVLTNISKVHGASILLNKSMMSRVIDRVGDDFFVIPSSVHEVLIVPNHKTLSVSILEEMVKDVNTSQVDLPDRLSDHVYKYTKDGLMVA